MTSQPHAVMRVTLTTPCSVSYAAKALAAAALAATAMAATAMANTPAGRIPVQTQTTPPATLAHQRLDLRAPVGNFTQVERLPVSFPSARQRSEGGVESDSDVPLLRVSSAESNAHPQMLGRAQELMRRATHEGLPLARLWENNSALISLGLNPKGKPGLWLIQKTR